MNFFNSSLLSFSLSLDCFAVSISQGIKTTQSKKLIIMAILFGLFQALMFISGNSFGHIILKYLGEFTKFISLFLLAFIGLKMIKEGIDKNDDKEELNVSLKDFIILAIATSIDALAAGLAFYNDENIILTTLLVGLFSFFMSLIGIFFGNKIGEVFGKKSEIFGGTFLIYLGLSNFFS